jgi:DNA-binding TFAR19-related protein (PDSD5 family)
MTKLLQEALEAVRLLPPENQDEIARAMLAMVGEETTPEEIDPAHLADVLESLAQAKRREFATDAEVEAAFRRFDHV